MKNFININDVKNYHKLVDDALILKKNKLKFNKTNIDTVSYTHLRAHET